MVEKIFSNQNNVSIQKPKSQSAGKVDAKFEDMLKEQQKVQVKLSAHAQERLRQQNIVISPQDMDRINEAVNMAERKGSRESLMLLRDLALVVNITNRTVITAIDRSRQKDKVFTNIDSTIIL